MSCLDFSEMQSGVLSFKSHICVSLNLFSGDLNFFSLDTLLPWLFMVFDVLFFCLGINWNEVFAFFFLKSGTFLFSRLVRSLSSVFH